MTPTTDQLATELTVQPVDHDTWPEPPQEYIERHYITLTLDLRTGQLAIHGDPLYRGYPVRFGVQPDPENTWVHWYSFPTPVPMHMTWLVSGHLTATQAEALLRVAATRARVLLANLTPVPERFAGGYDWTREAAAAAESLSSMALNPRHYLDSEAPAEWPPPGAVFSGLVTLADALDAAPELAPKGVAVMTDAELDAAAERLTRRNVPHGPNHTALQQAANIDLTKSWTHNQPVYLVGVLAQLYRMRAEQSGGLTPIDAARWFEVMGRDTSQITDSTPDEVLATVAAAEKRAAADEGLLLLGGFDHLAGVRANRRAQVREELAALGLYTQEMADRYEQARAQRAAMLLRVDAWGDPADGEDGKNRDATLAAMACMSRQGVAALRAKHQQATEETEGVA